MMHLPSNLLLNSTAKVLVSQTRNSRSRPFIPIIRKRFQPKLYYSFKERMDRTDETLKNPELFKKINIGFALPTAEKDDSFTRRKILRDLKMNKNLEMDAQFGRIELDLNEVEQDWNTSMRPQHIKDLAEHNLIFQHLFGDYAFFYPVIPMEILYDYDAETMSPVYAGNLLKPRETECPPEVSFTSEKEEFWTLIMTSPDGNLYDHESELLHWFVCNIPSGDLKQGEVITEYLRPIPPKGSGFHRYCFILYKQKTKLDFSSYKKSESKLNLKERSFKTFDFYKKYEEDLTPAGLSWFQADYDNSLLNFFHKDLQMKLPVYEYEFPKQYVKPQEHFPMLKPFNRYIDLHRDPKEMQKILLLKRLARVHPFEGEKPLHPFPQALPIDRSRPVWEQNEISEERDGKGKYRDVYRGDDRPFIEDKKRTPFPILQLK